MAFLDEMATILSSSTVAGSTTGWALFKGHLPDSTAIGDKAVAVIETAGFGTMARVDVEQPGLQLVVRGDSMLSTSSTGHYQDAQAKMVEARNAFHEYTGVSLTTTHYVGIWNLNHTFLGIDENERPIFVANFRVMRQTT